MMWVLLKKKKNHRLRATGASTMFSVGIPKKVIKSITGHKSSKALQVYKPPTVDQLQAVSNVLTVPNSSFAMEVQKHDTTCTVSENTKVYKCEEIVKETASCAKMVGSMFSGLNGCNVSSLPQKTMIVIVQQAPSDSDKK